MRVFNFSIMSKIENSKNLKLLIPSSKTDSFSLASKINFPSFLSFRFQYQGQNGKLRHFGNSNFIKNNNNEKIKKQIHLTSQAF